MVAVVPLSGGVSVSPAEQPLVLVALSAVALASVHVYASRLSGLEVIPRSQVLSVAGGISVSYVFLHLLPEVAVAGEAISEQSSVSTFFESHAYIVALGGFVSYYGLEWFVRRSGPEPEHAMPENAFWVQVSSFGVYNFLVGYLVVHREEHGIVALGLFVVAMGLHLLVNDVGIRRHFREQYLHIGRWILAAAVILGFGVGLLTNIADVAIATLFAFVGGATVLNVVKEEVPEEQESNFPAFALGSGVYAGLLLAL